MTRPAARQRNPCERGACRPYSAAMRNSSCSKPQLRCRPAPPRPDLADLDALCRDGSHGVPTDPSAARGSPPHAGLAQRAGCWSPSATACSPAARWCCSVRARGRPPLFDRASRRSLARTPHRHRAARRGRSARAGTELRGAASGGARGEPEGGRVLSRFGLRRVRRHPHYYEDGGTALRFEKRLRPRLLRRRAPAALFPPNHRVHLRAGLHDDGAGLGGPVMAANTSPGIQAMA